MTKNKRNSINTESVSPHQDIKVHSVYKLPRIARRHLNMVIEGEKEELMDFANVDNKKFILGRSRHDSISLSRKDSSFTSRFKMRMSTENVSESSSVMENNDEETEFTLSVAKGDDDSIQKSKNIIDTKETSLSGILFTRDPNKYLSKRKRDDNYYFLRLQNSFYGDRKRQQTLDPFWPRATQFRKRRKTVQPYNPFTMQDRRTNMPTFTHFSHKERIPKRKIKNKSHFETTSKFKDFGPSAQNKVPILFADLSVNSMGKKSGREYSESADKVRITLAERMEGALAEDNTEENTESSFSTNQALSKENIAQENSEFTETNNSSPPEQTTRVKDAAGTIPESTEVSSSSPGEQATDKISTENLETTAASINSPTDHLNENKDTTETMSESIKSKDNTSIDLSNSTESTYTENSKSTETGNSLSTNQTTVIPDTSETNTESTKKNSNTSGQLATDNTSAESSESREVDNSSSTDQSSRNSQNTFEIMSEFTESENSSSIDYSNSKEKTSVENWESTEAGNILPTEKAIRVENTSETMISESTAADNSSAGALTVGNISAESSESTKGNTTESVERIYRGYEANSSLTDQFNRKENTSADNFESTKAGNSSLTNQTTRHGNTSQTTSELIKAVNSISGRMAADNTSIGSLESIKANTTETTQIINRGYGANSSLTDQSNSNGNTSAEKSESKEITNSLPTNQITRAVNTSETNSKSVEANNSSTATLTAEKSFAESSESIMFNTTESAETIYRGYEVNSSLTDQFNSKENKSADNLESVEADNKLSTNQRTTVGNTSQTNLKSIQTGISSTERLTADNTSTSSIEFIKVNTTEATERIYRGYEANSSLTDQFNNKGITPTENSESKEVDNSLPTNQTTEVEKKPEAIKDVNSFPGRLVTDNTSKESLESNATESIEKIYRGYGINNSLPTPSNGNANTSAKNPESTEAGNNLLTNQTTRAGNTSQTEPESINAGSPFPEKLAADNTSAKSLESIKTNFAETTDRIYTGYRANSSLLDQSNNQGNTSSENSYITVAGNSLPTNQTTRVENMSETKQKSVEAGNSFPGKLATDSTFSESLESIKSNTALSTERIYSVYEANSSLIGKSNSKENTSEENSESAEAGNSLPTNQTTRVGNTSETNPELIDESKSFSGRSAADNSSVESSGNEGNSSESREEGSSSNNKEKTFIESLEFFKAGNSTPEIGNISPVADNSSSLGDKTFVAADNSSSEAGRSSSLEYDLHKISPSEDYLHKSSPLSLDKNASPDKDNLKAPNLQA